MGNCKSSASRFVASPSPAVAPFNTSKFRDVATNRLNSPTDPVQGFGAKCFQKLPCECKNGSNLLCSAQIRSFTFNALFEPARTRFFRSATYQ